MADKKPAKNVKALAAKAEKSKAAKAKQQPTVAKRIRLRGDKPKPKGAPTHVLTLLAQALSRKKGGK
jgi:hypothetical protein